MLHTIHYLDKKATNYLGNALIDHFLKDDTYTDIVVVCIGTKSCAGDSLGPLVGTKLYEQFSNKKQVQVYGTFERPVHALNLQKTITALDRDYHHPYVIAIDACLGRYYKIGTLQLVEEALQPGGSLGKELPPIGEVHLKGIVNNFGLLNYQVLENTSLTHVKEMADVLSRTITIAIPKMLPYIKPKLNIRKNSSV